MDEHALATTTKEEDLHTASQRKINLTWEYTQAIIALSVILANIGLALVGGTEVEAMKNALFVIIGFYFGRTNHARIGGVTTGR